MASHGPNPPPSLNELSNLLTSIAQQIEALKENHVEPRPPSQGRCRTDIQEKGESTVDPNDHASPSRGRKRHRS